MSDSTSEMTTSHAALLMNLLPSSAIQGRSALAHAQLADGAGRSPGGAGVFLREQGQLGHLTLRCSAENSQQRAAAERLLGVPLPLEPLSSSGIDHRVIRWMSPDEWHITLPADDCYAMEQAFMVTMPGHFALVNGSGGFTVYALRGERVLDLLMKSTPIDVHLSQFPIGKVVSTVFAKAGGSLRRIDTNCFELLLRRSFADYIWLWIQDASKEFGLSVEE